MIIIVLSSCPISLRGDLTLWLQEIATNVYVGKVSARVRDRLWDRITRSIKNGQATLVFSANNEQGYSFRVHATPWQMIDYEGLELLLKPSLQYTHNKVDKGNTDRNSKASKINAAKKASKSRKRKRKYPTDYVVLDIETNGLDPTKDEIIEIACLKVLNQEVTDQYEALIRQTIPIPVDIAKMTGIDDNLLLRLGQPISDVLSEILEFIDDFTVVAHNANFDMSFIYCACEKNNFARPDNTILDTIILARRRALVVADYKLQTLLRYFEIPVESAHRALDDCKSTWKLYQKLI